MRYVTALLVAAYVWSCSGDVTVHGVPESIELSPGPCTSPRDAGTDG